jgi:hypothetical protein
MWYLVTISQVLSSSFLEYLKLVELAMVYIVDNVEDERHFFTLAFMDQSFKIGLLPTYHLLCTCFHNDSTFCKISHMQTILSNGEELAIDIVMMARQYAFCIFWASFCKGIYILL